MKKKYKLKDYTAIQIVNNIDEYVIVNSDRKIIDILPLYEAKQKYKNDKNK